MKVLRINKEYTIIPEKNLIGKIKLEPRLMKLLCLLIENKAQLVTRQRIIEDIWSGYPGGEDGLTQAISFLRKILNDGNKAIIETIPKSGYTFNGEVEIEYSIDEHVSELVQTKKAYLSLNKGIIVPVLIFTIAITFYLLTKTSSALPDSVRRPVARPDSVEKGHAVLNPPQAKR